MEDLNKDQEGRAERLERLRMEYRILQIEARNAYTCGSIAEWAGKTTQSHVLLRQMIQLNEPVVQPA